MGFWQAAEAGDKEVQASQGEDAGHSATGRNDQPHLAAFLQDPLVRPDQDVKPGRIAEPGTSHVHDDRDMTMRGGIQQCRPELVRVGDIDPGGAGYHRHPADHLDQLVKRSSSLASGRRAACAGRVESPVPSAAPWPARRYGFDPLIGTSSGGPALGTVAWP